MWTETTRPKYGRPGLRYASDLTDEEYKISANNEKLRHGNQK